MALIIGGAYQGKLEFAKEPLESLMYIPAPVLILFSNMLIGLTQQTTISCNRPLYSTTTVR